jgi:hypothetical protein
VSPTDWPQRWQRRNKHRKATIASWDSGDARAWSKHPGEAQYNPHVFHHDEAVRALELLCVHEGNLISATDHKRTYYLDLQVRRPGVIVGVCNGEPTTIVFAEWHVSGDIHGRPISTDVLNQFLQRAKKGNP